MEEIVGRLLLEPNDPHCDLFSRYERINGGAGA